MNRILARLAYVSASIKTSLTYINHLPNQDFVISFKARIQIFNLLLDWPSSFLGAYQDTV